MMHRGALRPATILSRRTAARFAVTLGVVCLGWGGMSGLTVPGAHAASTGAAIGSGGPATLANAQSAAAAPSPDPERARATVADPLRPGPPEIVHLVAVMAEFVPDTNRFTTGDGTFRPGAIPYLEDPGTRIDPLPHDQAYFQAHLEFVEHYYAVQSGGRLELRTSVLPGAVRLPSPMAAYSPIGVDPGSEPLARLARDAWTAVGADPALSQALAAVAAPAQAAGERVGFIVFHAGIGRDLELTGTILDKSPQDIPSVYLDGGALGRLLGDPAFDGFDLPGGVRVRNTMVVPRTQTRRGEDVTGGEIVLPLSVNGMLTAQVGSFLGLPDLFDTQTGQSGIGRFGLMDGAGIFAMNGLFPPGLSAWERAHLGWDAPVEIDPAALHPDSTRLLSLPAAHTGQAGSVVRIPVAQGEYFLLENRHRDPDGEGVELTFRLADGSLERVRFTNLDEDFLTMGPGVDTLLPRGVLVQVSHHDFALPGGADTGGENRAPTAQDRQLNGGILIWHIDEGVVSSALADPARGINDDPGYRGVDLEEADGAQDIGFSTSLGFSSIDPTGSAFDFWWSGNDARVQTQTREITLYANRFDAGTTPAARANSGAPAWFRLSEFSDNLPTASVRLQALADDAGLGAPEADPTITRLVRIPLPDRFGCRPGEAVRSAALIPSAQSDAVPARVLRTPDGRRVLLAAGEQNLWSVDLEDGTARVAFEGSVGTLALVAGGSVASGNVAGSGVAGGSVASGNVAGGNAAGGVAIVGNGIAPGPSTVGVEPQEGTVLREIRMLDYDPGTGGFTTRWAHTAPMRQGRLREREPGVLTADAERWRVDAASGAALEPLVAAELLTGTLDGVQAEWNFRRLLIKHNGGISQFTIDREVGGEANQAVAMIGDPENGARVVVRTGSEVLVTRPDYSYVRVVTDEAGPFPAAFGDVDGDGRAEMILVSADSTRLLGFTVNGAVVDHFPIAAPEGYRFAGGPRLADIASGPALGYPGGDGGEDGAGGGIPELLVPVTRDGAGTVVAYDATGRLLDGPRAGIGLGERGALAVCDAPTLLVDGDTLITLSPLGELNLFRLNGHTATAWGAGPGPTPEAGVLVPAAQASRPDPAYGLLHQAEVYNWPNPARDLTHIRFQTSSAARIRIQIITQDGRRMLDRRLDAQGGAPEQVALDTSTWASGLYVVQVTASADGRVERKLFNMAVVH